MELEELDQYRKKLGLLTSKEIKNIRRHYGLNRKNLSLVMGTSPTTVYMYEKFRLQNRTRDLLMRRIGQDPLYFLELLDLAKDKIYPFYYKLSREKAYKYLQSRRNYYKKQLLLVEYKSLEKRIYLVGKESLNLRKIKDIVNYISSFFPGIAGFQLEHMIWHIDFLSYNVQGNSITGLAYRMHRRFIRIYCGEIIFELLAFKREKVHCFDLWEDYRYRSSNNYRLKHLNREELLIVDTIIAYFKVNTIGQIFNRLEYIEEEAKFRFVYGREKELIDYRLAYLLDIKRIRDLGEYF